MRLTLWLLLPLVCTWLLPWHTTLATELKARQEKVDLREIPKPSTTTANSTPSSTSINLAANRSARVSASINGHQAIEYLIDARTGQSLELDLRSNNAQASYHITAPAAPRALHKGHGFHDRFSVTLPRDGTYKLLVYLTDSAADKGESADFSLNIRLRNPG